MLTASEAQQITLNTSALEATIMGNVASIVNADFEIVIRELHPYKGRFIMTRIGKSGLIATKNTVPLNATETPAIFMHTADATSDLDIVHTVDFIEERINDE